MSVSSSAGYVKLWTSHKLAWGLRWHRYKVLVCFKMTRPVIFSPIRMLHSWANADDKKTIASFQALIISARPQVNRSPTPPKPSCGRSKACPAAQVTRACSQAKSTPISQPSPPTCALAYSFKSLSYSCVSSACRSFNAAKSFFVLSSSARIKTKPEKVKKCAKNQMWNLPWSSGSLFILILSSDWLLMIFLYYWAVVTILILVLWFYNSKPLTFASKGDRHLISPNNITPESHIHPLTSKIAFI